MQNDDRLQAVLAHTSCVLLPLVGPTVMLFLFRRSPFVRAHALFAAVASAAWLVVAVLIISVDLGHLSVDESRISTAALIGLAVAFITVVTGVVVNIRRAKNGHGPIGIRGWLRS